MNIRFEPLLPYLDDMLKGLGLSLYLTILAALIGTALGLVIYAGKDGKRKPVSIVCSAYIELFRNTPLLVQIYLVYFGLAQFGIDVSPFQTALITMSVNTGAYNAENLRGGFKSVLPGTIEAGQAMGMTKLQIFFIIKLKPALRNAFPSLINQFVMLFLFSSVASVISLPELFNVSINIDARIARTFEIYLVAGAMYYLTSFIMVKILGKIEKKIFKW